MLEGSPEPSTCPLYDVTSGPSPSKLWPLTCTGVTYTSWKSRNPFLPSTVLPRQDPRLKQQNTPSRQSQL